MADQLLASGPERLGGLGRQPHQLRALLGLEAGEHVAEEELPLGSDPRHELLPGARQPDGRRPPVSGLAAPFGDAHSLEPVDEPRRRRVVDSDPVRQFSDAQATVRKQRQGPDLARRQLPRQARMQRREQPAAAQYRAELVPALRELVCEWFQLTATDTCNIQKLLLADDLDGIAVGENVIPPDALIVELRGGPGNAGARARRGELVVDGPCGVENRCSRRQRLRLCLIPGAPKADPNQARQLPQRPSEPLEAGVVEDRDTDRGKLCSPGDFRDDGRIGLVELRHRDERPLLDPRCMKLRPHHAQRLHRLGRGLAENHGVRPAEDAEQRAAATAIVVSACDEARDLDELHQQATDTRERRHRPLRGLRLGPHGRRTAADGRR